MLYFYFSLVLVFHRGAFFLGGGGFPGQEGVAIRAGHHCTQALHRQLGAAGSLRASLYLYNTKDDVDRFVEVCL